MPDTKASADPSVASGNVTDADSLLGLFANVTGTNGRLTFANLKAYLLAGLAVFKPSGTGAAQGLVPNPGTTAGTTRFLCENGTWTAPPAGGASGVKNNYEATAAPTATDDSTSGYATGSSWMIPATADMWRCRDATAGAARWVKLDVADHPGYVPGRYYIPFGQGASAAGSANSTALMYLGFGVIKERITISQLGARVTTVASGGNFQLAIYSHNAATGKPGTLVGRTNSGGTGSGTNVRAALASNATLEPGNYWFAHQMDNTTGILLAQGITSFNHGSMIGSEASVITSPSLFVAGYSTPITGFGAWPADLTGATLTEGIRPAAIEFLVASVP